MASELFIGITGWNSQMFLPTCLQAIKATTAYRRVRLCVVDYIFKVFSAHLASGVARVSLGVIGCGLHPGPSAWASRGSPYSSSKGKAHGVALVWYGGTATVYICRVRVCLFQRPLCHYMHVIEDWEELRWCSVKVHGSNREQALLAFPFNPPPICSEALCQLRYVLGQFKRIVDEVVHVHAWFDRVVFTAPTPCA